MNTKIFAFLTLIIFVLTSCKVSKHYIQPIVNFGVVDTQQNKKVLLTAIDSVSITNFDKTFAKNYKSKKDFVYEFIEDFNKEAANAKLFASTSIKSVNFWSNTSKNKTLVDSSSDYIINFSDFKIGNRIETSFSSGAPDFNGIPQNTQTSTEYCIVEAKVTVYDIATQQKLMEFTTIGESSVFFLDFSKTFIKAKSRAIQHAVNYLKNGKTLYKKY